MAKIAFINLADQIERALADLEVLFNEACTEIQRDDLPDGEDWLEDLLQADEAAQDLALSVGRGSDLNVHWELTEKMLRRIDAHDEEVDRKWAEKNP